MRDFNLLNVLLVFLGNFIQLKSQIHKLLILLVSSFNLMNLLKSFQSFDILTLFLNNSLFGCWGFFWLGGLFFHLYKFIFNIYIYTSITFQYITYNLNPSVCYKIIYLIILLMSCVKLQRFFKNKMENQ